MKYYSPPIKDTVLIILVCHFVFCTAWDITHRFKPSQATQQPEPCRCLTYEQLAAYTAFMEVYIDSSQNGHKSDRKRFSDSVAKYQNLLKIK